MNTGIKSNVILKHFQTQLFIFLCMKVICPIFYSWKTEEKKRYKISKILQMYKLGGVGTWIRAGLERTPPCDQAGLAAVGWEIDYFGSPLASGYVLKA